MTCGVPRLPASIQTRALNLWYDDLRALWNVDIDIPTGRITALIGPSGCGKTTLLRCCNRLNERHGHVTTSGTVSVLGQNIYAPDVSLGELRKAVGMVFQRPNPLPLSVYDNVAFGMRVHGAAPSRIALDEAVEGALRDVLLWDEVKDGLRGKATRLSLAQQQKLCIARLLPLKPEIILMDEPCSALDAESTAAIERLMARLRGRYTILIVTHNMGQARRTSDESVFMLDGRIVEHGATAEMFERPQQPETARYVDGGYG
jgi:phosphate transport system ATP-binding protein